MEQKMKHTLVENEVKSSESESRPSIVIKLPKLYKILVNFFGCSNTIFGKGLNSHGF